MEKIWKDIPGYEGLYQVNNLGDIISLRKNCIMKPQKRKEYYRVRLLNKNNIGKSITIHKIVATCFLEKKDFKYYDYKDKQKYINNLDKLVINHKNENTKDNSANNLEWCTQKYNNNYGNRIKKMEKCIIQYDLEGNYIKEWKSIKEAKEQLKINNINKVLNGKYKKSGNYIFKYKESE